MEIFEYINTLFQKDSYAFVVSILGVIVSVVSIFAYNTLSNKKIENELLDIEVEINRARMKAQEFPDPHKKNINNDLDKLEIRIKEIYRHKLNIDIDEKRNKMSGFIDQSFLLYVVPAIIALTFTFAIVYLLISNQTVENYKTPEILKTGITIIIGYYFGVAVNNKPTASNMTIEDIKKQLDKLP